MGLFDLWNEFLAGEREITLRIKGQPTGLRIEVNLGQAPKEGRLEDAGKKEEEPAPPPAIPEVRPDPSDKAASRGEEARESPRNGREENGHRVAPPLRGGIGLWGLEKLGPAGRKKKFVCRPRRAIPSIVTQGNPW